MVGLFFSFFIIPSFFFQIRFVLGFYRSPHADSTLLVQTFFQNPSPTFLFFSLRFRVYTRDFFPKIQTIISEMYTASLNVPVLAEVYQIVCRDFFLKIKLFREKHTFPLGVCAAPLREGRWFSYIRLIAKY